ncbi:276_t:CDS:2 [Ambispora gerdemannii]|uniref:276_t:CDS:1 n=1 Tax=Ambispora gerdemannii TaxID=144530 RepID=A0A9N9FTY8_9GLOM|nr:276_t:CDS:2 [Ambispora gerdemannii]
MTSLHKRNEERTHEENQERAFIAASHRGDRSLEARMESARKASEVHKKRTGKALKITEEDVRNEEMYREVEPEEDVKLQQYHHREVGTQGRGTTFNEARTK